MGIRRHPAHYVGSHATTLWSTTMSAIGAVVVFVGSVVSGVCHAFLLPTVQRRTVARNWIFGTRTKPPTAALQMIYAPPGSGYLTADDEESELPDTYEPMMEYPGTMRPGKTPENMPFHDLPIGDDDPEPVPWPHFQQIEWHHKWEPPHPHPVTIEDYIEQLGRWATPEMEAAMRAGARRGVKERRELAETEKQSTLIMDDVDDDDDEASSVLDLPVELGDGVFGTLGSTQEEAATAEAVKPDFAESDFVVDDGPDATAELPEEKEEEEEEEDEDDDFTDFLLDLGLDPDEDEDDSESTGGTDKAPDAAQGLLEAIQNVDDDEGDDDEDLDLDLALLDDDSDDEGGEPTASAVAEVDTDEEEFDLDEDEEEIIDDGVQMVPLDDLDDDTDSLDSEDDFDDGGFDYDDSDIDMDGGDVW